MLKKPNDDTINEITKRGATYFLGGLIRDGIIDSQDALKLDECIERLKGAINWFFPQFHLHFCQSNHWKNNSYPKIKISNWKYNKTLQIRIKITKKIGIGIGVIASFEYVDAKFV